MGRFAKEVDDFIAAFKAGNDIGYRMRYFQLQQRQQQLREMQLFQRQQRGTSGGMPNDTQDLINQGRGKRFGPGSENETTPSPTKQATVQPKKADIPDATPTAKPLASGGSDGATPSSKGGSSGGGEKQASITDKYPGSYQTAALETGTMNDASPVRAAISGASRPLGGGAGGASPVAFGTNSVVMYKALTDLGVKPQVAAGAVGSMMGESGRHLNPAAYNPNDRGKPSGGALQWRAERLEGLYNFAGTRDINKIPIETQAKWMQQELRGSEKGALNALLNGNTVADGASAWTHKFERPANADGETARRTPMGEQFWKTIESGNIASTTPNRNQDAGNSRVQTAAVDTGTKTDATPPAPAAQTTPTNGATPATSATPPTPSTTSSAVPANDVPLPPKRPDDLNPEFPNNKGQQPPEPPRRPEMGPPMPESMQPAQQPQQAVGGEQLQPAGEATPQQDGWSFLDDIGQGFEQFGNDVESFFSDLNVPADWDVGAGSDWGTASSGGGDFGGIGGALGGIGDAIGGLFSGFNRGGMVR